MSLRRPTHYRDDGERIAESWPRKRRPDRFPMGPDGYVAPAPHTPWPGGTASNGRCRDCSAPTWHLATDTESVFVAVDSEIKPDGGWVVELSRFRTPMAVAYDETVHAGWSRYAAHVCPVKEGT
jgi:hypothetical protein